MRQAFLIAFHQYPEQLVRLVRALDSPDSVFYIHVDRKSLGQFQDSKCLEKLRDKPNVHVFSQFRIYWGGFSQVRGTLLLLRESFKDEHIGYFHFISAIDYPIKSINYILDFFSKSHKDYLQYNADESGFRHLVDRYYFYDSPYLDKTRSKRTWSGSVVRQLLIFVQRLSWCAVQVFHIPIRKKIPLRYYHGSNWFHFSRQAVEYILSFVDHNSWLLKRFKYTAVADESFFTMILKDNPDRAKHIVNDDLELKMKDGTMNRGGYILREEDYDRIVASEALFARKVVPGISDSLLARIDRDILNQP